MSDSNTGNATGAHGIPNPATPPPRQVEKIPLWRIALFYFVTTSSLALCIHSLRKLHSIGQPLSGMILDDLMIAAVFALLMTVREWRR